MAKLEVGGLALLINANYRENIGKVVELVSYNGGLWCIKFKDKVKMVYCLNGTDAGLGDIGHVKSSWLKPLESIKENDKIQEKTYEPVCYR